MSFDTNGVHYSFKLKNLHECTTTVFDRHFIFIEVLFMSEIWHIQCNFLKLWQFDPKLEA